MAEKHANGGAGIQRLRRSHLSHHDDPHRFLIQAQEAIAVLSRNQRSGFPHQEKCTEGETH
jgi:hypothetical protein